MTGSGDSSTSTTLIVELLARDEQAWRRLVRWVGPLLFHWCREAGLSSADREDVVQEVFRAVLTALPQFRKDDPERNFRGWLFVVTRSKLRDLARMRRKDRIIKDIEAAYSRVEGFTREYGESEVNFRLELFQRSLAYVRGEFEPRTWQAFWRTAVDGLTSVDAANELGMTPAAVRKCRSRVTARLREDLDDVLA